MAVLGGVELPDDCVYTVQFATPTTLKDDAICNVVAFERRHSGYEIGRHIADNYPWEVISEQPKRPGFAAGPIPELQRLSVVILTQDQLASIVKHAKEEGYAAGCRAMTEPPVAKGHRLSDR